MYVFISMEKCVFYIDSFLSLCLRKEKIRMDSTEEAFFWGYISTFYSTRMITCTQNCVEETANRLMQVVRDGVFRAKTDKSYLAYKAVSTMRILDDEVNDVEMTSPPPYDPSIAPKYGRMLGSIDRDELRNDINTMFTEFSLRS